MNREEICRYIEDNWGISGDHPFAKSPDTTVFRHPGNRKWFALMMEVEATKLGIAQEGCVTVLNAKCDAALQSLLLPMKGFYPAYHMNKNHWISAVPEEMDEKEWLYLLIDKSYSATK